MENRGGGLHDVDHKGEEAHVAELTALCKDKQVIRVCSESPDMYASLDKLNERLGRKLRKYKERKQDKQRGEGHAEAAQLIADDALEEEEEPEVEAAALPAKPMIVRQKSFDMTPISVDDAALCLEYIDHDFYVFRNAESGQINVIYKRNSGGLGLIEPEE